MFDQGINQDFGFDNSIVGNNNVINNDMNVDVDMMGYNNSMMPQQNMMGNMGSGTANNRNGNQNNMQNGNLNNSQRAKNSSDTENNFYEDNSEDDNIKMLKAIRTFVDGGRAEFIDKIINLYNDGIFNEK